MTISSAPLVGGIFYGSPSKLIHDFIPLMLSQLLEYLVNEKKKINILFSLKIVFFFSCFLGGAEILGPH